jgi:hypothetical protein
VQVQVEQRVERGTPRSNPTRKRQRPLHGVDPLHPHAQQVARACLPMGLAVWDTFVFSNHVRLLTGHCCCNCRCRCCPRRRGKIVQTGGKEGGLAISTCSAVLLPSCSPCAPVRRSSVATPPRNRVRHAVFCPAWPRATHSTRGQRGEGLCATSDSREWQGPTAACVRIGGELAAGASLAQLLRCASECDSVAWD